MTVQGSRRGAGTTAILVGIAVAVAAQFSGGAPLHGWAAVAVIAIGAFAALRLVFADETAFLAAHPEILLPVGVWIAVRAALGILVAWFVGPQGWWNEGFRSYARMPEIHGVGWIVMALDVAGGAWCAGRVGAAMLRASDGDAPDRGPRRASTARAAIVLGLLQGLLWFVSWLSAKFLHEKAVFLIWAVTVALGVQAAPLLVEVLRPGRGLVEAFRAGFSSRLANWRRTAIPAIATLLVLGAATFQYTLGVDLTFDASPERTSSSTTVHQGFTWTSHVVAPPGVVASCPAFAAFSEDEGGAAGPVAAFVAALLGTCLALRGAGLAPRAAVRPGRFLGCAALAVWLVGWTAAVVAPQIVRAEDKLRAAAVTPDVAWAVVPVVPDGKAPGADLRRTPGGERIAPICPRYWMRREGGSGVVAEVWQPFSGEVWALTAAFGRRGFQQLQELAVYDPTADTQTVDGVVWTRLVRTDDRGIGTVVMPR